jgi:hypothetical protein
MPELFKEKDSKKKDEEKKMNDLNSKWTREQELLLAEWAEKASCYRWLHGRAEKKYRRSNYAYTIPVIIMSTLTGTANFAMDSFVPEEHKKTAMAAVGGVNILAGIISTLQNFLRYAELMESHRSSGVAWSKLGRDISIELALDPPRRKPARDFLNICRAEYDRLIEQSPLIDDVIINQFHSKFKNTDINKPEMCNGLDKCEIYQPTKEEKAAEMIANVTTKLSNNKKRMFTIDNNPKPPSNHIPIKENINQNKNELHGLANLGRVSRLKKMSNNTKNNTKNSPKKKVHNELKKLLEKDIDKLTSKTPKLDVIEKLVNESESEPVFEDEIKLDLALNTNNINELDPEPEPELEPEPGPQNKGITIPERDIENAIPLEDNNESISESASFLSGIIDEK